MWLKVSGPVERRVALSLHHHVNHSTHPSLRDYVWALGGEAVVVPLSSELGTTAYVCVGGWWWQGVVTVGRG